MSGRDNDMRIRPGRIRDRGTRGRKAQSFVGQVMRAAKKAGHTGYRFSGPKHHGSNSRFGRGRFVGVARGLSRTQRRVVVKARVVRHRGTRFAKRQGQRVTFARDLLSTLRAHERTR